MYAQKNLVAEMLLFYTDVYRRTKFFVPLGEVNRLWAGFFPGIVFGAHVVTNSDSCILHGREVHDEFTEGSLLLGKSVGIPLGSLILCSGMPPLYEFILLFRTYHTGSGATTHA